MLTVYTTVPVGGERVELSSLGPEPSVLPLDHPPVGPAGLEPATSRPPGGRSDQAELRPERTGGIRTRLRRDHNAEAHRVAFGPSLGGWIRTNTARIRRGKLSAEPSPSLWGQVHGTVGWPPPFDP
jgi:hypothetical protein